MYTWYNHVKNSYWAVAKNTIDLFRIKYMK